MGCCLDIQECYEMTKKQLEILQHSLGLDEFGQGRMYRNHFCAGSDDEETCRELIALGFMTQHARTEMLPYFNCSVTEAGKKAVGDESPGPPKLTAGQRRYREFLNADSGLKFGEWLKMRRTVTS
jgi:hypothetical protein